MPKKPIYEAFESLNQIRSKYLKESKSLKDLKITFQQLEKLVDECDPMESGSKTAYNKVIKKLNADYNISKEDAKELLKSIYSWEESLKEDIKWQEDINGSNEFIIYLPLMSSASKMPLRIGYIPNDPLDEITDDTDYEFYFTLDDHENKTDYELDDRKIAKAMWMPFGYEAFRRVYKEDIEDLAEQFKEYFIEIPQEELEDTLAKLMDDSSAYRFNKAHGLSESRRAKKKEMVKESTHIGGPTLEFEISESDMDLEDIIKYYIKTKKDPRCSEDELTKQKTITEERRPPYSDDEMEKYYDMLDESREYQKELRKLDRGIDISRDENNKFGVNWPARGTQSVEEVEKFVYALDQAAQFCRELNTKYADIL